jgi:hypothetical protein
MKPSRLNVSPHAKIRRLRQFMAICALSLLVPLTLGNVEVASTLAQPGVVEWSEPIQLSSAGFRAGAPAIIADPAGNVHVLWSQMMSKYEQAAEGDTLFYARWDGKQWTTPIDVLVSPQGGAEFPDLAVTADGMLHAVWSTGGSTSQLMYANAPACCADNPQAWSQPISLGSPVNLTTAIVADAQGRLHVAFGSLDGYHVVYRRSDDGGRSWPIWVDIPAGTLLDDELPAYPRLAVDERGRVHAVWSVLPWPGRAVMYARSDDGGNTWTEPEVIDSPTKTQYASTNYGPTFIDVETHGKDEVHLIWDGAPTVERNHIWSSDGGRTWSTRSPLFPEISQVGRAGWNDMALDSGGTLHAVSLGAPVHATWNGVRWSDSSAVTQSEIGEWVRISASLGNQLHVVWINKVTEPSAVWYARGVVSTAPAVAPQTLPTYQPNVMPTQLAPPTIPIAAVPFSVHSEAIDKSATVDAESPVLALWVSLIPVFLLMGIVVIVTLLRRRIH